MKLKLMFLFSILLIIPSAILGALLKSEFTDIGTGEDPLQHFNVGMINDDLLDNAVQNMHETLDECPIILRVMAESEEEFVFLRTKQRVKVLEVYKGDNLRVGDSIYITKYQSSVFFEQKAVNMGFVNTMIPNDEYLIFLESKIISVDNREAIYETPGYIIAPIFAYKDRENELVDPIRQDYISASYSMLMNNEFFAVSQEGIDKLNNLKDILQARYPAD